MRKSYLYIILLLFTTVFLFVGCGESTSSSFSSASSIEKSPQTAFEQSECYQVIKTTLEGAFDYLKPTICYDAKNSLINISFTAPEGTANAMLINKEAIEVDWGNLCDNLNNVGKTVYEACLSEKYNVGCIIIVLSDANSDNVLFASLNGDEYYNCINEQ